MQGYAFHFPYIAGGAFTPGVQVFSPGEPTAAWSGHEGLKDVPLSWPGQVPYMTRVWTVNIDFPTTRPIQPIPNDYATAMANSFFLGGIVGKSKG